MRLYKDSKELPLWNYERIMTTDNPFFVLKGYEEGIEVTGYDETELREHFQTLIEEYVVSIDSASIDFANQGKKQAYRLEILKLSALIDILEIKIKSNDLLQKMDLSINNSGLDSLFEHIRIVRSPDLNEQISIIRDKIEKYENDINDLESKQKKTGATEKKQTDINDVIVNIEQILERTIDLEKTSLYRFGVMLKLAKEKIDHLTKARKR
ncbi:hypothetical protein GNY06_05090 [Elizabethkingia argentiflava]|uniref:Uncharacterized protein n=1 Tax=Elizabethkingia argenteiflava TaxID=2681556 RepID=A0A845PUL3_9FLAO|nr:hypothetical protein [Elizabethkingia argenteiflava]NAW50783.1 hypothetical protein [Elizabethkingia argenteiflava]